MRKKFYIGAHPHIPAKLLRWNFFQILQLSIRSGAHKRFRRFFYFSHFLTAIYRKLWRHVTTKMRTVYCICLKKGCKPRWNRPLNGIATPVRTMSPSSLGALQKKEKTHHIFAPAAGAHYGIFPKLCMVIELVETTKKVSSIFWSNVWFFLQGAREKLGLIYRRAVSLQ